MTVGGQAADQIDHEVRWPPAVPGMFNLGDVLELIERRFDDGAFTQQQFVGEWQQAFFYVGSSCAPLANCSRCHSETKARQKSSTW